MHQTSPQFKLVSLPSNGRYSDFKLTGAEKPPKPKRVDISTYTKIDSIHLIHQKQVVIFGVGNRNEKPLATLETITQKKKRWLEEQSKVKMQKKLDLAIERKKREEAGFLPFHTVPEKLKEKGFMNLYIRVHKVDLEKIQKIKEDSGLAYAELFRIFISLIHAKDGRLCFHSPKKG